MKYTLEEIYLLVGRDDKTAGITFRDGSDSYKKYGNHITAIFLYEQWEREKLDELVKITPFKSSGYVRAKILVEKLSEDKQDELNTKGMNSDDILEILYSVTPEQNAFHSKEKREIKKIVIETRMLPKGRDLDWMYGFKKRLVSDNIGLCPRERVAYLAGKYYYEPDKLDGDELDEIFPAENQMVKAVEEQLLSMKYQRDEITDPEKIKLAEYYQARKKQSYAILDRYLGQSGSSLKKMVTDNIEQAVDMIEKVLNFKDRRLNVTGRIPIYLDIDSFLHIYMRHVEEMQVNKHFEHKDNFQWSEEDVLFVMQNVIRNYNEEIQNFLQKNPGRRYSRYGAQSAYFEGDYYTFHIEPSGRISTFHKNKKKHEDASK